MKLLYFLFGSKYSSVICIILAIANRVINVLFVSYANRDKMILILQSKTLLQGHGLACPQYYFNNPDSPFYDYTPMWPPGYPLLLAPFLKVFDYNIYWAITSLDIIAALAFIFIVRKLCRILEFSATAINISTLIAGCFEYIFISESQPTDAIALVLFLIGFAYSLKLIADPGISWSRILLTGVFLFLPCVFRYSYPPMTLTIPLVVLVSGFIKKDVLLKRKGLWLVTITVILTAGFALLMKLTTGSANYVVETQRGIYPENIIHWFPVIPSSFINIAFLTSQMIQRLDFPFSKSMLLLEIVNVSVFVSLFAIFFYQLSRKKFFAVLNPFKWFLLIGSAVSASILVLLAYLSFTYHIQETPYHTWNYTNEGRYMAFINVFIQLAFIGCVFFYKKFLKNFLLKIIVATGALFLFIDVAHNIYFHTRVAFNFRTYKGTLFREIDYAFFSNWLLSLKKQYPDHEILTAAPGGHSYYTHTTTYYGGKGLADGSELKKELPRVKKKSLLLVILFDTELADYHSFVSNKNVRFVHHVDHANFYMIELFP